MHKQQEQQESERQSALVTVCGSKVSVSGVVPRLVWERSTPVVWFQSGMGKAYTCQWFDGQYWLVRSGPVPFGSQCSHRQGWGGGRRLIKKSVSFANQIALQEK